MKRTNYAIKNIITGFTLQIITILLGFISRKLFIDYIGLEFLGINGLLSNVVSMLSLVELGIGSAIYYSLYKPLAKNDYNEVHAIMNLYSKLYKYIGIIVGILGIILMPFLKYLIKTNISNIYVNIVYIIFIVDSVLSYFLAYRSNILSADQKSYVLNNVSTTFSVSTTLLQIVIVIFTKNYILFLIVKLILGVIKNLIIYYITNNRYSYLNNKDKPLLKPEIKKEIIKNAKALFIVNIAVYCVFGTDNILLSAFVGITTVGLYSNYFLLINTVNGLVGQIFQGIRASFGNFLVEKTIKEAHEIFEVLYFVNFWISTFCSVSLVVLLNPFIELWLGKEMLFPMMAVVILVFNFYSRGMTNAIEVVRNAAGLYSPYPFFKFWALVEGIVNLILSTIFAVPLKMGMLGIFLGTSISTLITVYVLPWNVYKYVFKMSSKVYYLKYFIYTISTGIIVIFTYYISRIFVFNNNLLSFLAKTICCIVLPNIMLLILFGKSKELGYLINKFNIKEIIKKIHK
jgi:Membrane protein involved in the export of O-antigen and teichoic acid